MTELKAKTEKEELKIEITKIEDGYLGKYTYIDNRKYPVQKIHKSIYIRAKSFDSCFVKCRTAAETYVINAKGDISLLNFLMER